MNNFAIHCLLPGIRKKGDNKRLLSSRTVMGVMACVFFFLCQSSGSAVNKISNLPFSDGETITYDIKKLKMNVGQATIVYNGTVDLRGREVLLITVTAQGFRFFDEERIFLDPVTFHPYMIKRDLDIFGKKEKIVEIYHKQHGEVMVIKAANGKHSSQVIKQGERFDNIYGFIYRYRVQGQFKAGEECSLHLPTRDVTFQLDEQKTLKVAGQEYHAYHMNSVPKKYKVWFEGGNKKIPLMIDGTIGFGRTSMVMKDYKDGDFKKISR
ncbi:MAG: hypothetical protein JW847_06965 [Candidatus Omnitrophica bacterium]|nr:hypothetical protein [Candidatus Omnitrophota bacterium]